MPQNNFANKLLNFLFGLLAIFSVVYSVAKGLKEVPGGDFHAFWFAGQKFFSSLPVYGTFPESRQFIYPPFAALFFFCALSPRYRGNNFFHSQWFSLSNQHPFSLSIVEKFFSPVLTFTD